MSRDAASDLQIPNLCPQGCGSVLEPFAEDEQDNLRFCPTCKEVHVFESLDPPAATTLFTSIEDERDFWKEEAIKFERELSAVKVAAVAFIEIAEPVGNKYVVGKRFLFWQARDSLKKAAGL